MGAVKDDYVFAGKYLRETWLALPDQIIQFWLFLYGVK